MSKIKILPENLANQIAAGEVVERPSSVVKELVENSVDAGASTVEIQVEGNGTRLIRVMDDGEGMDQDDVLLSLERHGTSKIKSSVDLGAIRTLGFRGEALPSISSVSKLIITSRPRGSSLGMRVEVRFGKLVRAHEMGCPHGTVIEVRELFGNVPARRKFLKSTGTEVSHMAEVAVGQGLVHPELGVRFSVNGRDVFDLPVGVDSMEDRIRRLAARRSDGPFIVLSEEGMSENIHITGCLLPPDSQYGTSARLRLFVNGRAVRDRMLTHAVAEGMHNFLLKGRRPAGALFLNIPPGDIDVNVHPTKQEIRFLNAAAVHKLVAKAVRFGLMEYQVNLKRSIFGPAAGEDGASVLLGKDVDRNSKRVQSALPFEYTTGEPVSAYKISANHSGEGEPSTFLSESSSIIDSIGFKQGVALDRNGFKSVRIIGQALQAYILCEVESGLVAIDQHAVQERIIFEKLKEDYRKQGVPRQALLFPKILEFDSVTGGVLQNNSEDIKRLGLEIEPFGGNSYVINAVPALMTHLDPEEVALGILTRFTEELAGSAGRMEDILASMACKAAIKAGQNLQQDEMEHLVARILESPVFSHCPHGRPVMKQFTAEEISRWFHRT